MTATCSPTISSTSPAPVRASGRDRGGSCWAVASASEFPRFPPRYPGGAGRQLGRGSARAAPAQPLRSAGDEPRREGRCLELVGRRRAGSDRALPQSLAKTGPLPLWGRENTGEKGLPAQLLRPGGAPLSRNAPRNRPRR